MVINVSKILDLYNCLLQEYQACKERGYKPSQIKTRIDCVLKSIHDSIGTGAVVCKPGDYIISCNYEEKKEYQFDDDDGKDN